MAKNKKKKLNVDRILGLSAMIISLLTLIIFIYQTNIIHRQSRLSVTPRLSFTTSENQNDTISSYQLSIQNKGIGPAIINSAKIVLSNGKRYNLNMSEFWEEQYPKLKKYGVFRNTSSIGKGTTLSANETRVLSLYEFKPSKLDTISKYLQLDKNGGLPFNIELIYSSIYEDKWRIDYKKNEHPVEL